MTPVTNEHGQLLCPLHAADDPHSDRELYLVRTGYVPLDLADLGWLSPRAQATAEGEGGWPGEPTSTTWEVRCNAGHALATPGGDSEANEDTDLPTDAEWALLRAFLDGQPRNELTRAADVLEAMAADPHSYPLDDTRRGFRDAARALRERGRR